VKEVSRPQISATAGRQVSAAPDVTTDVTRRHLDNDTEESSDADGWDDAWDDEQKWGDMEVRTIIIIIIITISVFVIIVIQDSLVDSSTEST